MINTLLLFILLLLSKKYGEKTMRKYAYLKQPIRFNENNDDFVHKIMIEQTDNHEVCLYYYKSNDATQYSFSEVFENIEDIFQEWNEYIDENGWITTSNSTHNR